MLKSLKNEFKIPKVFEESEYNFWLDEYISKNLLKAHLNPNYEGASRKFEFINSSVNWIYKKFPVDKYNRVLDLGCGPGLYAERLYSKGYEITGIDFSKRSIEYAKQRALKKNFDIEYENYNYLDMNYENIFDLAMLIYCDYGALSKNKRKKLLEKVFASLKNKGKFIMDVFSINKFNKFIEKDTWEYSKGNNFWTKDESIILNTNKKYENNISLERTIVITDEEIKKYNIWHKYFSMEDIFNEVKSVGFNNIEIFLDVSGREYCEKGGTIAIIGEKL